MSIRPKGSKPDREKGWRVSLLLILVWLALVVAAFAYMF